MNRIACTAIDKRIMLGRVSKNGLDFVGNPVDVTSDCLKAVIDKIGIDNTEKITIDGVVKYEITVKKFFASVENEMKERQKYINSNNFGD
jgi:hypothetical protein